MMMSGLDCTRRDIFLIATFRDGGSCMVVCGRIFNHDVGLCSRFIRLLPFLDIVQLSSAKLYMYALQFNESNA